MRVYARHAMHFQRPAFSKFNIKINQLSESRIALKPKEGLVDRFFEHSDLALYGPRFQSNKTKDWALVQNVTLAMKINV